MKKSYLEPDFDLIKIGLVADAFYTSSEEVEDVVPTFGGDDDEFENGDGIPEL